MNATKETEDSLNQMMTYDDDDVLQKSQINIRPRPVTYHSRNQVGFCLVKKIESENYQNIQLPLRSITYSFFSKVKRKTPILLFLDVNI
jgi:hypothetical protein